jgi:hypothetical protein
VEPHRRETDQSAPYYDYAAQVLHFGTDGGKVVPQ